MDDIEKSKEMNDGIVKYTIKELIGATHIKLDKQAHKLACIDKKLSGILKDVSWHKKLIWTIFGLLGSLLFLVLKLNGVI